MQIIIPSIFLVLFIECQSTWAQQVDSIDSSSGMTPKKTLIQSAILPGWGQWSNKKHVKAVCFGILSTSLFIRTVTINQSISEAHSDQEHEDLTAERNTRLLLWILSHTIAGIDAYVDTQLSNLSDNYSVQVQKNRIGVNIIRYF